MLHEFIYDYKVYAVVKAEQYFDSTNHGREAVEVFKTLNEAQSFFRKVAQDPISHDDILSVAKWVQPAYCRPAKNSSKPDDQELMNLLSLRVFNGAYLLIEIKPPIKFEECCVESIKKINDLIGNGKVATVVLCIAEVHDIFSSHTRLPALLSMLSSAYSAVTSDGMDLAIHSDINICENKWIVLCSIHEKNQNIRRGNRHTYSPR